MIFLQRDLREKIYNSLKGDYHINPEDIQFSIPPDRKFGDLSTTIPFVIAKKEKENPHAIGNQILDKIKNKYKTSWRWIFKFLFKYGLFV
jgi:arginyl-tRNA synthetase